MFGDKKKASFSIATFDLYKNAKGEKVEDTQMLQRSNLGAFGGCCRKVSQERSGKLPIEGKLVHRDYETGIRESDTSRRLP